MMFDAIGHYDRLRRTRVYHFKLRVPLSNLFTYSKIKRSSTSHVFILGRLAPSNPIIFFLLSVEDSKRDGVCRARRHPDSRAERARKNGNQGQQHRLRRLPSRKRLRPRLRRGSRSHRPPRLPTWHQLLRHLSVQPLPPTLFPHLFYFKLMKKMKNVSPLFPRYYGGTVSESVLGRCLREVGVPRSDFVVSTKCGRYVDGFDFSADRIASSVDESLARLGLDYVDLLQCHDIEFGSLDQARISDNLRNT